MGTMGTAIPAEPMALQVTWTAGLQARIGFMSEP